VHSKRKDSMKVMNGMSCQGRRWALKSGVMMDSQLGRKHHFSRYEFIVYLLVWMR
jgi:hypothetical protein